MFKEWWAAHTTGFLLATNNNKSILAVTGLFPVPESWATKFLARETNEHELSGEIIRAAKQQAFCKYWYFSGLAANTNKDVRALKGLRRRLPSVLGYSILAWVREDRVSIGRKEIVFVSEGSTMMGESLLKTHFGFPVVGPSIGTERPRFKRAITLLQIKEFLVRSPFFRNCEGLREAVELEFAGL